MEAQAPPAPRLVRQQRIENPGGQSCTAVENGRFSHSLALGDLDGDGHDDLLVAASANGSLYPGAFVFYSTGAGFGTQPDAEMVVRARGVAMADVNGDGVQDAIVVAMTNVIYVFHGGSARLPPDLTAANANWVKSVPSGLSGSVAGIDVNADGIDDIIVGGPQSGPESALVFYGSPTGLPADLQADFIINESPTLANNTGTDGLHYSISGGFERVTRDGNLCDADNPRTPCGSQFAIGVPGTDVDFNGNGYVDAGEHEVGIALVGPRWQFLSGDKVPSVEFGYRLGHAGDVNGDGETDLIVSAKRSSTRPAKTFVYLGTSAGFAKMQSTYSWAVEETLGGQFVEFGATVGSAGDINGDGYGDIFIGDPRFDNVGGRPQTALGSWGKAFIYLGGPPTAGDPSGLGLTPAPADITLHGDDISGEFAFSFARGDINGDGATDIVVGDPRFAANCLDSSGAMKFAYVGSASVYLADVDQDGDGRTGVSGGDCNDHDPTVFPGSPERFDGKDNDCNGEVDDRIVSIVATDALATESGATVATLTVTRSGPTTFPLAVSYTVGGTATAGSDYAALSGVAIIPANEASTTVTIVPFDDTLIEQSEAVLVTVVTGEGYVVGSPGSATVSISSDDRPQITVAATDGTASEAGPAPGTFTVSRSGNGSTAWPLTVFYSIGGSATPGSDYAALSGSVTIPAGASSATITINPIDDSAMEGPEAVTIVLLANPFLSYTVGLPRAATVTIVSDESVTIAATDPIATEAGPTTGTFTVSRTGSTASPLTVFCTEGGPALAGSDYMGLATTVTIPANAVSATISVTPIDDLLMEGNETVTLALLPNAEYVIGAPNTATVTIVSDERVFVVATDATATELPVTDGTFTVTRTAGFAAPLTVNYTIGGSATAGYDYLALSGSVTIPAGAVSATIVVRPITNFYAEANETVTVSLSPSSYYTVGWPSAAVVTIVDWSIW